MGNKIAVYCDTVSFNMIGHRITDIAEEHGGVRNPSDDFRYRFGRGTGTSFIFDGEAQEFRRELEDRLPGTSFGFLNQNPTPKSAPAPRCA